MRYIQMRHFKESPPTQNVGGYYAYNLVRTGHGWKIPKYTLTVTWDENPPLDFRL